MGMGGVGATVGIMEAMMGAGIITMGTTTTVAITIPAWAFITA
jgi:hypothetical protein